MSEIKLCKNCKQVRRGFLWPSYESAQCAAFPDPVSGKAGEFCSSQRDPFYDYYDEGKIRCGSEGRLFEPKRAAQGGKP